MSRLPTLSLDGAHVLITGGSSGIGRAVANLSASKGAHVTFLARNPERLAAAVDEIEASCIRDGQRVLGLQCDVTEWEQVADVVAHAERDFGPIDVLFACAGYCFPASFLELPIEEFQGMVGTNLLGTMHAARAVARGMVERGHGHIAMVSSMGGLVGVYGYSAYSASKFGVVGFAEVLRNEMKPHGVGVSVLCPPNVDTPGLRARDHDRAGGDGEDQRECQGGLSRVDGKGVRRGGRAPSLPDSPEVLAPGALPREGPGTRGILRVVRPRCRDGPTCARAGQEWLVSPAVRCPRGPGGATMSLVQASADGAFFFASHRPRQACLPEQQRTALAGATLFLRAPQMRVV